MTRYVRVVGMIIIWWWGCCWLVSGWKKGRIQVVRVLWSGFGLIAVIVESGVFVFRMNNRISRVMPLRWKWKYRDFFVLFVVFVFLSLAGGRSAFSPRHRRYYDLIRIGYHRNWYNLLSWFGPVSFIAKVANWYH